MPDQMDSDLITHVGFIRIGFEEIRIARISPRHLVIISSDQVFVIFIVRQFDDLRFS